MSVGRPKFVRTACKRRHNLTEDGATFLDGRGSRRCAACYDIWRKAQDHARMVKSANVREMRGPKVVRPQWSPDHTNELLSLHARLELAPPYERQPIRDRIEQLKRAQK